MSSDTKKLVEICEQLGPAEQTEVMDLAQALLAKHRRHTRQAIDEWFKTAVGAAKPGVTTESILEMTRGDS